MKQRAFQAFAATGLAMALMGCATKPDTWVELKGQRYSVEIADSEAERNQGLMFREEMAKDRGMFFVHPQEALQAYWMKNTRIPLDILYFAPDLTLVSASLNTPPCSAGDACPPYPSSGPAQFVLELNAGEAQRLGVVNGDKLTVSPSISLQTKE